MGVLGTVVENMLDGFIRSRKGKRGTRRATMTLSQALRKRQISAPILQTPRVRFAIPPNLSTTSDAETRVSQRVEPPRERRGILKTRCRTNSLGYNVDESLCSNQGMSSGIIAEVTQQLGMHFDGIPYAICGVGALSHYGLDTNSPKAMGPSMLSLAAPVSSKRVMKAWAIAKGMYAFPSELADFGTFGLTTRDGEVRMIRVKFIPDAAFQQLSVVTVGSSSTPVLALPSVADQVAEAYIKELAVSGGERQHAYATLMRRIIDLIVQVDRPEHRLDPERVPHLACDEFWVPFTLSNPETIEAFARAGIAVDESGWVASRDMEDLSQGDNKQDLPSNNVVRDTRRAYDFLRERVSPEDRWSSVACRGEDEDVESIFAEAPGCLGSYPAARAAAVCKARISDFNDVSVVIDGEWCNYLA